MAIASKTVKTFNFSMTFCAIGLINKVKIQKKHIRKKFFTFVAIMGRIMAIDYGFKRTGIAVTDPERIIATGLDTIHTKNLFDFLKQYVENEQVDAIVFGYPTKDDGSDSEPVPQIKGAMRKCRKLFPFLLVEIHDESYTSVMAHQAMIDGGLKKKQRRNKGLVDKISATLILQSYLESKRKQQ
jgi:putative Holliday junction resolvase